MTSPSGVWSWLGVAGFDLALGLVLGWRFPGAEGLGQRILDAGVPGHSSLAATHGYVLWRARALLIDVLRDALFSFGLLLPDLSGLIA